MDQVLFDVTKLFPYDYYIDKLTLQEFLDMMHQVGIGIDKKDLEDLYKIVDLDHDSMKLNETLY